MANFNDHGAGLTPTFNCPMQEDLDKLSIVIKYFAGTDCHGEVRVTQNSFVKRGSLSAFSNNKYQ